MSRTRTCTLIVGLGLGTVLGLVSAAAQDEPKKRPPSAAQPAPDDPAALAARVKEIFRTNCFECHGDKEPKVGVRVLDVDNLVARKKKVVPGKPDDSKLFQAISATDDNVMPPDGRPRLSQQDIDTVRLWISKGAVNFPDDAAVPAEPKRDKAFKDVVGVDYVLKKIRAYIGTVRAQDRRYLRFFSFNHILTSGATPDELELQRQALAKAINHLSGETEIVQPQPIEPTNTVFVVDIRKLGWHAQPFTRMKGQQKLGTSSCNLYDLVLLEYPYAIAYEDSETYERLCEEFLVPAGQIRPIPYVRADWFVCTATLPPLYEDLLQMPYTLQELEEQLKVKADDNIRNGVARRAGMTVSGVSRNNRVVERHPLAGGAYWKSFDFRSSKGRENMFADPINLNPSGGELIFTLPNGLQGYYVADAKGVRIELAPTDIVTDKIAEDKTVRNGLSCIRCHDAGMKTFSDRVRPALLQLPGKPGFDKRAALDLYPEEAEMEKLLKDDGSRFLEAMKKVLGKEQAGEPLTPVSKRFLDGALSLPEVAAELGLAKPDGLEAAFRMPNFAALGLVQLAADGVVRRDSWEDYYDLVVRQLALGTPVTPVDGFNRRDFPAGAAPFDVELKTNKPSGVLVAGDLIKILVVNKSTKKLFIELIGSSAKGAKVIVTSPGLVVEPGQTYATPAFKVRGEVGKEQITLYASDVAFPAGELLTTTPDEASKKRGRRIADRVVHAFYRLENKNGRLQLTGEPVRLVKKTIDIETR
jgi:serine/threonine-protein kinase